jgi:hypothetical protein
MLYKKTSGISGGFFMPVLKNYFRINTLFAKQSDF